MQLAVSLVDLAALRPKPSNRTIPSLPKPTMPAIKPTIGALKAVKTMRSLSPSVWTRTGEICKSVAGISINWYTHSGLDFVDIKLTTF